MAEPAKPDGKRASDDAPLDEALLAIVNASEVKSLDAGATYQGQWQDEQKHGGGILTLANGSRYEGQFQNDQKHGHGKYTYSNGSTYSGQWLHDVQEGEGAESWSDGSHFTGTFRRGEKHGRGVFSWSAGASYDGDFCCNEMHGEGSYCWNDGRKYTGQWNQNQMGPRGTMRWADARVYEGEFYLGKKHGKGVLSWPDGRCYDGQWENNRQHGVGLAVTGKGLSRSSRWEEGHFVCWLDGDGADEVAGAAKRPSRGGSKEEPKDEQWHLRQLVRLGKDGVPCTKVGTNGKPYSRRLHVTAELDAVEVQGGRSGAIKALIKDITVTNGVSSEEFMKFCRRLNVSCTDPGILNVSMVVHAPQRTYSFLFENQSDRDLVVSCIQYLLKPNLAKNNGSGYPGKASSPTSFSSVPPREGSGKVRYENGSHYEGQFSNSLRHGKGKFVLACGTVYTCEWKNDLRHGPGREDWADGTTFEGSYLDGDRAGHGVITWLEGSKYTGQWIRSRANGHGSLVRTDGSIYKGTFVDDFMTGSGTMTWPDGTAYEGQFLNNRREGKGKITWVTGSWKSYDGEWKEGMQHGRGIYTDQGGKEYVGTWIFDDNKWKLILDNHAPDAKTDNTAAGEEAGAEESMPLTKQMKKLWQMGFCDAKQNFEALRQGGSLEGAAEWLNANGFGNSQTKKLGGAPQGKAEDSEESDEGEEGEDDDGDIPDEPGAGAGAGAAERMGRSQMPEGRKLRARSRQRSKSARRRSSQQSAEDANKENKGAEDDFEDDCDVPDEEGEGGAVAQRVGRQGMAVGRKQRARSKSARRPKPSPRQDEEDDAMPDSVLVQETPLNSNGTVRPRRARTPRRPSQRENASNNTAGGTGESTAPAGNAGLRAGAITPRKVRPRPGSEVPVRRVPAAA